MNVVSAYLLTETERGCISSKVRKPGQSSVTEVKESPYISAVKENEGVYLEVVYLLTYHYIKKE